MLSPHQRLMFLLVLESPDPQYLLYRLLILPAARKGLQSPHSRLWD